MTDGIIMETKLFEYGIHEEKSDIRAHVTNREVIIFKTSECRIALSKGGYRKALAYQPNCKHPTAYGVLVPPDQINDVRKLKFISWSRWDEFDDRWDTTTKGKWAVDCVIELIRLGRFPFWLDVEQTKNIKIDIEGTDILLAMNQRIQVKCDYPCAKTGNLYIQTHECNPLKLY